MLLSSVGELSWGRRPPNPGGQGVSPWKVHGEETYLKALLLLSSFFAAAGGVPVLLALALSSRRAGPRPFRPLFVRALRPDGPNVPDGVLVRFLFPRLRRSSVATLLELSGGG